jgi:ABC-2 type transport system ATP-binding protein
MQVLETEELTKLYPTGGGCSGITIQMGVGESFGLLGPNGAGKSTFIKTLVGLLQPSSGSARILGRPLGDLGARRLIGFLPENFRYHEWMTAGELLEFHGLLAGLSASEVKLRTPEVLALVNLSGVERKSVRTFSKGMQQRLGLAVALIHRPRLLFLDEPTSALDPIGRVEMREIIQTLQQEDVSVFLNSHLLTEVEKVCQRVAVIREGRVVAQGKLEELLGSRMEVEIEAAGVTAESISALEQLGQISQREALFEQGAERFRLQLTEREQLPQAAAILVSGGARVYRLAQVRGSLEDLFVELIEGDRHV